MLHKLSENVWFGDGHAPFEAYEETKNLGGIINVAHHLRSKYNYWERLSKVSSRIPYFRIAKKDAESVDDAYLLSLMRAIDTCRELRPNMPIVVHCQMGGHRGPASALFAEWMINRELTAEKFEEIHAKVKEFVPKFRRKPDPDAFANSLVRWCLEWAKFDADIKRKTQ